MNDDKKYHNFVNMLKHGRYRNAILSSTKDRLWAFEYFMNGDIFEYKLKKSYLLNQKVKYFKNKTLNRTDRFVVINYLLGNGMYPESILVFLCVAWKFDVHKKSAKVYIKDILDTMMYVKEGSSYIDEENDGKWSKFRKHQIEVIKDEVRELKKFYVN
jgi:hypothetical protein